MKRSYNKNYFEGWYFKQIDENSNNIISFIPSVSFTRNKKKAYIQVIYKSENIISDICEYDINYFSTVNKPFSVSIDNNYFSKEKIKINFNGDKLKIKGKLNLSNLTLLNTSLFNPNIMGFLSYIPFMQCNHGVLSMNHNISGSLIINGKEISFNNGRGYIEKDWGKSFPSNYIWIQCNSFKNKDTSLFFSIANIPFLGKSFNGYICNLLLNNKQYRFATYTNSKIKFSVKNNISNIEITNKKYKLRIETSIEKSEELLAPKNGNMDIKIKEALSSNIKIELYKDNTIIYKDISSNASIEIVNM